MGPFDNLWQQYNTSDVTSPSGPGTGASPNVNVMSQNDWLSLIGGIVNTASGFLNQQQNSQQTTPPPQQEAPKKDNTNLWLGIGAALVVLTLGVLILKK